MKWGIVEEIFNWMFSLALWACFIIFALLGNIFVVWLSGWGFTIVFFGNRFLFEVTKKWLV